MNNIFIVEDERIIAMDLAKRLKDMNYNVSGIASSSDEAIAQINKNIPDLILMDIVIKGELDGIATADKLKYLSIPVIYLTAYSDEETLARAKLTEPYGYILKPFKDKEIQSTIEMALYKSEIEKKLKGSEELHKFLFDNYPEIYLTLNENYKIESVNQYGANELEYTTDELKGESINLIITDHDQKVILNSLEKIKADSTSNMEIVELKMSTKYKNELWAKIRIKRSERNNEKIFIIVCEDITKLKKMEQHLIDSQKLESIGTLAGGIAHDFNNMLTMVMSNISLAQMKLNDDEVIDIKEVDSFLSEAVSNIYKTKDLTQQLLTFSKGGKPSKKICYGIAQLLKGNSIFATRGTNIECKVYAKDKPWALEIDEGQIGQVINNILINAIHSMPQGGEIYISIENVNINDSDKKPLNNGKYIKIKIKDKGTGIESDKLSKIFEPYYTTKQDGHGLGLSITYSIIKNHNGHIEVKSEIGNGTEFTIYLPAVGRVETDEEQKSEKISASQTGKILFMDDEEAICTAAEKILKQLGHSVICASDGRELLQIYDEHEKNNSGFDLVIMDLTIKKGLGGLETMKILSEKYPQVKAIVSSGYSNNEVMSDYKRHGFIECISKPYTVGEFNLKINNVLLEK